MNVAGLNGVLADPQPPIIGGGAGQAVAGNDARLTDARTPLAHAASHKHGGTDEVAVAAPAANAIPKAGAASKLDKDWYPDFVASGAAHAKGAVPDPPAGAGTAKFLREDATWAPPVAALPELVTTRRRVTADTTVLAGYGAYVPYDFEVDAGIKFEVEAGAVFEVGG